MEDAGQPRRLARLDAERDDVLDLEVDGVADPDAVAQALLADLDRRALDAEVLADERRRAPPSGRRAAPLNTPPSFSACSSEAASSMNTPRRQLPSVMTFGVSAIAATVSPLTSVPSTVAVARRGRRASPGSSRSRRRARATPCTGTPPRTSTSRSRCPSICQAMRISSRAVRSGQSLPARRRPSSAPEEYAKVLW